MDRVRTAPSALKLGPSVGVAAVGSSWLSMGISADAAAAGCSAAAWDEWDGPEGASWLSIGCGPPAARPNAAAAASASAVAASAAASEVTAWVLKGAAGGGATSSGTSAP